MKRISAIFAEAKKQKQQDDLRCQSLIDRVCKASPIGKKLIENALSNGVKIRMSDEIDALGTYSNESKEIQLNKEFDDNTLLSTLVHECRHAEQTIQFGSPHYSMYTSVAIVRAKEADAMAHQCAATYQMRRTEVDAFLDFSTRHPGIMLAYQNEMEQSKDMNKALNKAFKAWYDDAKYVAKYDDKTLLCMSGGSSSLKAYKTTLSAEQLANAVCMKDGKPYVEPAFFNSRQATTVTEIQAHKAAKIEKNHFRNFFRFGEIPTSADYFYVRQQNGTVLQPKSNIVSDLLIKQKVSGGR